MMYKTVQILIAVFALSIFAFAVEKPSTSIRTTPAAPKFSDAERQSELARRRAAVGNLMNDDSTLILFSASPKIYANDVDFYYRQENNLYYLTNLKQNGATLVMRKSDGKVSEFLFLPKRDPQAEAWNGKMYSTEDAARISGINTILDAAEQKAFLDSAAAKTDFTSKTGVAIPSGNGSIYLIATEPTARFLSDEYPKEIEFAKRLSGRSVVDARPIFRDLRLVKSPHEIRLMEHAIDITGEALGRSMGMIGTANWEYEVHAEVDYTFRRRNADYWGYPSIVGCGVNATTLHYVESQGAVNKGDLMLMDVGAEYDHYTADVTRTFPVSGKFSKEQKEIYQIVYDAQEAAAKTIKPGGKFSDPSEAAAKVIENGLAKLGLITEVGASVPGLGYDVPDGAGGTKKVTVPQYKLWYIHGWGHWLGMNVHDVGGGGSTVFKEGMIMTNEPGIYIREDALDYLPDTPEVKEFIAKVRPAYEKYKTIGVRIEDDMLVTKSGVDWMTKALPRSIADIEIFMANASKQMFANASRLSRNPYFAGIARREATHSH
ncbi:MAG: aminopeptidase P N-terminal domain-containing protein [Pyrinomonadaceae bacterium]|nr:aminopeptidase P N-terminal domain-containing protein [Pyrinomonadaceae bacterium]